MPQNIYDNPQFFEGYQAIRNRPANFNTLLENPAILSLLPDLTQKSILDIGCGAGDFANYCVKQGAQFVQGVDVSEKMLAMAKERFSYTNLQFQQCPMEQLNVLKNEFDIIVSSLAIHYTNEYQRVIEQCFKGLKTDGHLIMSMQHPIYTASMGRDAWMKNEQGQITGYEVSNYFHEGLRKEDWLVEGVEMYHRTISTVINTVIQAGFTLLKIVEPYPTDEATKMYPALLKIQQAPAFFILHAKK